LIEDEDQAVIRAAAAPGAAEAAFAVQAGGRLITIADFASPDRRVAIYVDGASIHLGQVLCRDHRIEYRLKQLDQPWSVLRLR
jgi:hypothetical protein